MFDAGRNYVILAAALLVLTAAMKLQMDTQSHGAGIAMLGAGVEKCQSSGFNLGTKRIGCRADGAAFGR